VRVKKRESTSKENWNPGSPQGKEPGKNPKPTFEIEENYEVFEERKNECTRTYSGST